MEARRLMQNLLKEQILGRLAVNSADMPRANVNTGHGTKIQKIVTNTLRKVGHIDTKRI